MLTRRQFARGLALTVAGLLVPAPLIAAAEEPVRRLWALDGSMLGAQPPMLMMPLEDVLMAGEWARAADGSLWLIKSGVDAFARLSEFRAPSEAAIHDFGLAVHRVIVDLRTVKAADRRARLLTARSRPAYRRRAA